MTVVCCTCKLSDMEVEARGVEGPVIVVAVSGFEVASRVELGRVPEATSKISEKREVGPKLRDFADKDGVVVDGFKGVVEGVFPPLYRPRRPVYAQLLRVVVFH